MTMKATIAIRMVMNRLRVLVINEFVFVPIIRLLLPISMIITSKGGAKIPFKTAV